MLKGLKTKTSVKAEAIHILPSKTFIQVLHVYIMRNIKPCQAQLILNCVLL